MKSIFVAGVAVLFLSSCGGGGDSGGTGSNSVPDNVTGTYQIRVEPFTISCENGVTSNADAVNDRYVVDQVGNNLVVQSGTLQFTGTIDNGDFVVTNNTPSGISTTLAGSFTDSGWSGDFSQTVEILGSPCSADSTFSGNLV